MSISNLLRMSLIVLILILVSGLIGLSQETSDDVLDYYLMNVKRAIKTRDPVSSGASYSYYANMFYINTDYRGQIGRVDTIGVKYFYSWGEFDSTVVIKGDPTRVESILPEYEDVFDQEYLFNTFPNDTGGTELAIGFDTPNDSLPFPTGLLIINRENFIPIWLYLSYPEKPDYRRFSKAWRFTEREGMIFPDSVWIVAAKDGIFGTDDFRIEIGVSDLVITPPGE